MNFIKYFLMSLSIIIPSISFAQGGDDPAPGIDIIIKEDPTLAPIANFSMTSKEMEPQNRKMSFNDRREYLIKRMLIRLDRINEKNKWEIEWHKVLYNGLSTVWCPPKECHNTVLIINLGVPKDPNTSNIKFRLSGRKINDITKKPFVKHRGKALQNEAIRMNVN